MDIKFVWIEEFKIRAYILTTIDTFTRVILARFTDYSIKRRRKRAWERINIDYLQPNKCLKRKSYRG
jgi:transposase InsO family protein